MILAARYEVSPSYKGIQIGNSLATHTVYVTDADQSASLTFFYRQFQSVEANSQSYYILKIISGSDGEIVYFKRSYNCFSMK